MEYPAKDIYPQAFGDLNPDETYHYIVRHFTDLPDQPFVFSGSRASKYSMRLTSDSVLDGLPAGTSGMMNDYRRIVRRRLLLILLLALLIVASLLLDFMLGPSGLPLQSLWQTLTDPASADPGTRAIVWDIRLPYAVMAIIVGLALGLAGAEMQTILNNPLASPFTLGVSSAAAFGAALAIVLGIGLPGIPGQWFISANAFIFALLAALLLDGITRWTRWPPPASFCSASRWSLPLTLWSRCCSSSPTKTRCRGWCSGPWAASIAPPGAKSPSCWSPSALVMPPVAAQRVEADRPAVGRDRAISFGINVRRLRLTTLLRISILSALSVAFVGPIGFIGPGGAAYCADALRRRPSLLPARQRADRRPGALPGLHRLEKPDPGGHYSGGDRHFLGRGPVLLSIILRHRGQV